MESLYNTQYNSITLYTDSVIDGKLFKPCSIYISLQGHPLQLQIFR